ncbi:MAG: hypothetical protein IJD94_03215 [Clostridia bacterium]|nr:hypothetical protein [Clostridia bacterium]
MTRPLLNAWTLRAASLPERMASSPDPAGFSLPGADALADFAALLGDDAAAGEPAQAAPDCAEAPFPLPAMIPEDVGGEVSLFCEIDFGALSGDRCLLVFDQLIGRGEILIGDIPAAVFGRGSCSGVHPFSSVSIPCALAVDLTASLRRGGRATVSVRFDGTRPAGIPGPVLLHTSRYAHMTHLTVRPGRQVLTLRAQIHAEMAGRYALRVRHAPHGSAQTAGPAREITLSLSAGETRGAEIGMNLPGERFSQDFAPDTLAAELLYLPDGREAHPVLCERTSLLCGYPGRQPGAHLPLAPDALDVPAPDLLRRIQAVHARAVSLYAPAPDWLYRALTREGIACVQHISEFDPDRPRLLRMPCVSLHPAAPVPEPPDPCLSAWQMCGMVGYDREADSSLEPEDLLAEAAGRPLHAEQPDVQATLSWLRAVFIRQRAEAARQSRFSGALCACGEDLLPDIAGALAAALSPLHLSALPLCGAWWTGTRFSASIEAFIPEGACADGETITACAVLEYEDGRELARLEETCGAAGGYIGVLEAALPEKPCVLMLTTRLVAGDGRRILEESAMPVYVGSRGPLEAAFL